MKLLNFRFQRNGVAGNNFYHAIVKMENKKFVITFESSDDDLTVKIATVRVVCIDQPNEAWRGDEIGYNLRKLLWEKLYAEKERRQTTELSLYDLTHGNKIPQSP